MDEFQFKSPAAIVDGYMQVPDIAGESQIDIINLNVSPRAIWGTNGTAITVEPKVNDTVPGVDFTGPAVTFEDPLFG